MLCSKIIIKSKKGKLWNFFEENIEGFEILELERISKIKEHKPTEDHW